MADTRGDANNDLITTSILTPIVDSILAMSVKPKVVIFGGDAAYRGGYDTGVTNLTKFKEVFTDRFTAAGIPSAFAVGNHELYTMHHAPNLADQALQRQQDVQNYFNGTDLLTIQKQNVPGHAELDNLALSFHIGNSLFIIADSFYATTNAVEPGYGINQAQQDWMKGLLANNTAAHTFVLTHVPAWSPEIPSANPNMTDTWQTITTSGNANNTNASILFAGHEHIYYRTLHDGTYQVLAGTGGAPMGCEEEGTACNYQAVYPGDVYAMRYNYAVTSINGREITVSVFDQNNSSVDNFHFFDYSGVSNTTITNAIAIAPDEALQQPTGILAASGNTITNSASISNVVTGIDAVSNNTITNSGSIKPLSGGNGIHVYDNNTITNTVTGSITGNSTGLWGIRVNTGNTVLNNGTVSVSGTNSIAFLAQGDNNTFTNNGTLSASGTDSYAAKFLGTGNAFVNSGAISGNIRFDAGNNTFTNNGTFDGSGGLYKVNSGTLTLRGSTSYTGGTYFNGGIINVTQNASLGALSGGLLFGGGTLQLSSDMTSARSVTLNSGGGTFDTNGNTLTLSGVISGSESLTKAGAGTLELTGTNTYTGGTVLNNGSVKVANWANLGGSNNALTFGGGTLLVAGVDVLQSGFTIPANGLNFNTSSGNQTVGGVLSGSGTVTVSGSGRLTLSGTNTYTGGTVLNSGTLYVSSDANLGASSGTLTFNGGTLQPSLSLSTSRNITVNSGGGTFNNNGQASSLGGSFSGSGPFTFAGSAGLTISGNGSGYTGQATMSEGLLFLSSGASLGGTLTVNQGATVGGYGTFSKVVNNGIVSPGGSIGTLTLNSNYTQGPGGTLNIEIASTTSNDLLAINGTANLSGSLKTLWSGGYVPEPQNKFIIITASSGITGQFTSHLTNITPTVLFKSKYDIPNQVYLMVERDYTNENLLPFLTANQMAVGSMLNSVRNATAGDLDTVLHTLDDLPTYGQAAYALDQLAPKGSDAQFGMGISSASFQTGNLSERLSDLRHGIRGMSLNGLYFKNGNGAPIMLASINPDLAGMLPSGVDERWGFFVRGNAVYGNQKDTPDTTGYDFTNTGITMGSDYHFTNNFIAGLMLGLNTSRANVDNIGSKVKMDGYTLGTYGTYYKNNFYLDGSISYGFANYDNTRRIVFPGLDRTATASPKGNQLTVYGGTGYDFRKNNWIITPNASFQYVKLGIDSYIEKGANAISLDVDKQNTESLLGNIGGKVSYAWQTEKALLMPNIRASYGYEFSRNSQNVSARLAQGSSPFSIQTASPDRGFLSLGTGITVLTGNNLSLSVNYDAQIGEGKYIAHSVNAGLRMWF
ncbi:MAG: autotransporter domain-containing protein [Proteobacteria bacterium]|nr:autotransporter domain-containing protein [Pseudomonadota bacterium]